MAETTTVTEATQSQQLSPRKHRSIHTLQDIINVNETMPSMPLRVPQSRLPGGRRQRGVLAAIENIGSEGGAEEQPVRRRRRKSDFDVWKDEAMQKKAEGPFDVATAVIDASPTSFKHASPKSYRTRGGGRTKDIEALVDEYLSEGRRKVASPVSEETEEEEEITATIPHTRKNSVSALLLAHSRPNPELTPFPTPPLSLLHRKFSSPDSPQPPLIPPSPVLPSYPPPTGPSPLQQMRAFRAHFESLVPSPPPQPRRQPPPSSPPLPHQKPRRQSPQSSPPEPRHHLTHQSPPLSPHHRPNRGPPPIKPTPSSISTKYAFTLPHLPPITHHSRTAIVTLTPTTRHHPGSITLQLRNLAELKGGGTHTYHIPTHGLPITITEHSTNTSTTYAIEDLPLKHLPAVRYARHFVDVAKRGTVVGRVEVREKRRGGSIWVGRRWADGRFEALKEDLNLRVEITKSNTRILRNGREAPIEGKYMRIMERAKRMHAACEKALEEEEDTEALEDDDEDDLRKRSENVSASSSSTSRVPKLDKPFHVDSTTTFVPAVGWCRRGENGWWSMLFLDGVRLEIDSGSGNAVWVEKAGTRRVLERGMEMRKVRERVRRFVEKGL